MTEALAEPAPDDVADEPAEAYVMPHAGPLTVDQSDTGGKGDDAATEVADSTEDAPVATTEAHHAEPGESETHVGEKQQLLAACRAAEHWLQAELRSPGETRPDEILRVLRAAIERAETQRKPREQSQAGQPRQSIRRPRESTKEAGLLSTKLAGPKPSSRSWARNSAAFSRPLNRPSAASKTSSVYLRQLNEAEGIVDGHRSRPLIDGATDCGAFYHRESRRSGAVGADERGFFGELIRAQVERYINSNRLF